MVAYAKKAMASVVFFVFLWCKSHCVYRPSSKEIHNQWRAQCKHPGTITKGYQEQTSRKKLKKGFWFHQSNTPEHKILVSVAVVRECDFGIVEHIHYSPDLATSIICSPTWNHLTGNQYRSDAIIFAVDDVFNNRMTILWPMGSKHWNSDGRTV